MLNHLLLVLFLLTVNVFDTFQGKVIRIIDGDTIVVLIDYKQVKIRLEGIDCPESNPDFGNAAKKATSSLCFAKEVTVVSTGIDRYGRILGKVYFENTCINEELLKMGLAWHYKKYNADEDLAQLEYTARMNKIGLWSQPNPIAPWDYRRN